MKLGAARDGTVYCTRGTTAGIWTADGGFVPRGSLPNPETGASRAAFGLLHGRVGRWLLRPVIGAWTVANVWPVGNGDALATVGPRVFRSGDGGRTWTAVHRLPASSGPMGVLPTSVCEHDGVLYLAEYPLGSTPARIRASTDRGRTWETRVETDAVRHFHGAFRDPYGDCVWATAGDTDDQSAVGRLRDGEFRWVGGGSQRWRAVGLAFTPSAVLWGMDCSYADEVALLRLDRDGGDPVTVGTTDASVYYAETVTDGDTTWVALATAAEVGVDSTAPPARRRNESGDVARVLVASSTTGFTEWHELAAFERRRPLAASVPGAPAASAYVFLAADPDVGLVVNPFNTRTGHGRLRRVPVERLRELTES